MQYRNFGKNNCEISALGFGCMRLPQNDRKLCEELIYTAIQNGINYFDTAYMYSGNETLMGEILKNTDRSKIHLATKLPPMMCFSKRDFEKIFSAELKRLQTDYIDYYLIHCLADIDAWHRLCNIGFKEWVQKKKEAGKILRIGFSYHGGTSDFKKLVDDYDWDFVQLQFNYMDEFNQAGREGVEYAAEKGLPVIVMEPLRGGSLTYKLPEKAKNLLIGNNMNAAEIGLRWVLNHNGILTVLSGMNTMEQLNENLETASRAGINCMSEKEFEIIEQIKSVFRETYTVGCTGCGYCLPCPHGVSIPSCFEALNNFEVNKSGKRTFILNPARRQYMHSTAVLGNNPSNASLCQKCGLCEKKCPQKLNIRELLDVTANTLEPAWFMIPVKAFRKFNSR